MASSSLILEDGTILKFSTFTVNSQSIKILHSDYTPAVIYPDGTKEWWCEGRRHRPNQPAIENLSDLSIRICNGKIRCKFFTPEMVLDTSGKDYIPAILRTYNLLKNISIETIGLTQEHLKIQQTDGTCKHYWKGILHREDEPAVLTPNNTTLIYYQFGVKHNLDGPAIIINRPGSDMNGNRYWYHYGLLHRDDGPAVVTNSKQCPNRVKISHYYYGLLDNKLGPAYYEYNKVLHSVVLEFWFKLGLVHRDQNYNTSTGPAMIINTTNYTDTEYEYKRFECWLEEGKYHRLDGPAATTTDRTRDKDCCYFIYDREISEKTFKTILNYIKKIIYKLKSPLRKRLIATLLETTKGMELYEKAMCKDLCSEISTFVY